MPAVKSIPVRTPEGTVVGQRFEPSEGFRQSLARNHTPMARPDGATVMVNRKLAANGHYADKGYTEPKKGGAKGDV